MHDRNGDGALAILTNRDTLTSWKNAFHRSHSLPLSSNLQSICDIYGQAVTGTASDITVGTYPVFMVITK